VRYDLYIYIYIYIHIYIYMYIYVIRRQRVNQMDSREFTVYMVLMTI
jgi:hypothetical protein